MGWNDERVLPVHKDADFAWCGKVDVFIAVILPLLHLAAVQERA